MLGRFSRFCALFSISLGIFLLSFLVPAYAVIGVGVGTGKIEVDEPIKSGGIYELPAITVYNTGDETATYAMQLTLNETQDQHKPDPSWFSFKPASFQLEPGKAQLVTPTLKPPLNIEGGEYFGYLEAYPDATVQQGSASIGVAAATKLSFKVESSGMFNSLLNRAQALYLQYAPWSYVVTATVVLIVVIYISRKYIRFNVQISKVDKKTKDEDSE